MVEDVRATYRSLPFDDAAAFNCAELRADLAARGLPISPNDSMIAGIARSNGLILVTNNTTEFSRVSGLEIEDWQIP